MDKLTRIKIVQEAENYLALFDYRLRKLQESASLEKNDQEKRKIYEVLDDERIKFSQMMTEVVIFKARHGIFTTPKRLK